MMKILVLTFLIAISTVSVVAQQLPQTEKERKAAEKAEKKSDEAERRRITVDFDQMLTFPKDFVGGPRRAYRVWVGEMKTMTIGNVSIGAFEVRGKEKYTFNHPTPDNIMFATSEDLSRSFYTEYRRLSRSSGGGHVLTWAGDKYVLADVYFELHSTEDNGRQYYIAKSDCIVFLDSISGIKRTPVGACPLAI